MSRLAIILAASKYATQSQLPACRNDARAIEALLDATECYEAVLTLIDEETTATATEKLAQFVEANKSKSLDEVLFYFSGHGSYRDDAFRYILGDYDGSKPHQTSIDNSDLDALLRQLTSKLTVKLIDACQSGVPYIKGGGPAQPPLEKHLKESGDKFSQCYFMFSSARDQSSYADDQLSDFTRAFLECVAAAEDGELRYKRLIDGLADAFEGRSGQRPFYVTQGSYTEVFCKCQFAGSWGQGRVIFSRSWGHPIFRTLGPPARGA